MLDLALLQSIKLYGQPFSHKFVAHVFLRPQYAFPRKTEIRIEGLENLPRDRTVMLAMNHTDMYNYWPLQYHLYRLQQSIPFISVWVKGKYYHHPFVATFLKSTNNIPVPSRGYVITTDFRKRFGRKPTDAEYRALRQGIDHADPGALTGVVPEPAAYIDRFENTWDAMIAEVERLNATALDRLGLNVLVFPQGTRSRRLSQGHTGLAQMALHLRKAIVPIGCSGSDRVYPTTFPWARGGRIVYRFGTPIELDRWYLDEPFLPLGRTAGLAHAQRFREITEVVMDRINDLVDPEYRYSEDRKSEGVQGVDRFL